MQTSLSTPEQPTIKNDTKKPVKRRKDPLMDSTGPLKCNPIPGQHLRWLTVNDPSEPRNMQWAEGQNYVAVHPTEQGYSKDSQYTKDMGSDIRVTGKDGITLVLMKQPMEDYEESIQESLEFNNRQVMRPIEADGPAHNGLKFTSQRVSMNATNIKRN